MQGGACWFAHPAMSEAALYIRIVSPTVLAFDLQAKEDDNFFRVELPCPHGYFHRAYRFFFGHQFSPGVSQSFAGFSATLFCGG